MPTAAPEAEPHLPVALGGGTTLRAERPLHGQRHLEALSHYPPLDIVRPCRISRSTAASAAPSRHPETVTECQGGHRRRDTHYILTILLRHLPNITTLNTDKQTLREIKLLLLHYETLDTNLKQENTHINQGICEIRIKTIIEVKARWEYAFCIALSRIKIHKEMCLIRFRPSGRYLRVRHETVFVTIVSRNKY